MVTNEQGRSMIEMLGILAVVGVLTIGGVAGYTKAIHAYRVNKIKNQIATMVTTIHTLYMHQVTYKTLNNETAIQTNIVPREMLTSDNMKKITNVYGGEVFIGNGSIGQGVSEVANDQKAFLIEYNGLPRNACVDLASTNWVSDSMPSLMGIKISGSLKSANTTTSTPQAIEDVPEIQFQDNGAGCRGANIVQGLTIACVGGSSVKIPLSKAQAARACNCGSNYSCSITFKYF